jgi:hypothetical protein
MADEHEIVKLLLQSRLHYVYLMTLDWPMD